LPPVHTPAWQESDCVQALPSPQVVPSAIAGLVQPPVALSQTPATWHASLAVQSVGDPDEQTPV
jgi:hypothetical protein